MEEKGLRLEDKVLKRCRLEGGNGKTKGGTLRKSKNLEYQKVLIPVPLFSLICNMIILFFPFLTHNPNPLVTILSIH